MRAPREQETILVVDDDDANRYAVSRTLSRAGFDVTTAATGAEALEAARAHPDLILLDVRLPDIDGFEVCQRLRADASTASIAIVHLTAHAREPADRATGLEGGADAYLTQPVRQRELLATVEAMLRLRRAENEARMRAEEWRTTFEAIPDAMAVLDGEGRILQCNSAWGELTGLDRESAPGRDALEALALGGATAEIDLVPGAQGRRSLECRSASRHLLVTYDPIRNASRDGGGVLSVRDVTAQRQLEDALREHARDLEVADERKNEFLAMLAHELRTPLGALSVASEVLEELAETFAQQIDPQAQRAHATIRRQVGNLSRMVDDLLDVSRITQGKVQLRKRNIDVSRCVTNVLDGMRPTVTASGHELRVALSEDTLVSDADPTRYEQIVSNLVDNAVKYTPEGGRITVETEAVDRGGRRWAELRVTDTGAGIPEERLSDVFGLFVQFDRTLARSRGGLGLGLTLVRRLAELHGGEVEARSPGPGKGSTFIVRLPLLEGVEPTAIRASESRAAPVERRRVLLVEDNDDLRELMAWKLRRRGYDVVEAADGVEALELARQAAPEVALVDLGLPRMDGIELAEALRDDERTSGVHLVALTGYGSSSDLDRTREAGFRDHMVKPIDVDELLSRLDDSGEDRVSR